MPAATQKNQKSAMIANRSERPYSDDMETLFLSPKELALAIGVGESSVKRWVDSGRLGAVKTAGGHRRITRAEAVRFVRKSQHKLVQPDLLGLSELASLTQETRSEGDSTSARLTRALELDEAALARAVIVDEYLRGASVAGICDGPLRDAMETIGERWKHAEDGVMIEHRATDTCVQALSAVRSILADAGESAPVALGCAVEGDQAVLGSLAASMVLREIGFRDVNLGANTPWETLEVSIGRYRPRLVWISVTHAEKSAERIKRVGAIGRALEAASPDPGRPSCLVLGGRALDQRDVPESRNVVISRSMTELAAFGKGLLAGTMPG